MTRSARLPAESAPRTVSATGSQCSWTVEQDGTTKVTFDGALLLAGQEVLSPHQLLRLWEDQALMQLEIGNTTLRANDVTPPDLKAKMAVYGVAVHTIRSGRAKGLRDDQVPGLLDELKRVMAEQGAQQAQKINHFETVEFGERLMSEMAEAWRVALTVEWLDDPDDGTSMAI
ncbi:hypothetical protein [Streptomyces sp. NRRL S-350]|uniref:hypothetical protein n=1 Tax=Streptomyces sp. NRRL S-350 TaxID=1463902 RepID=UPI00131D1AFA|nr:hypothetical protein [Streptomyces sp. NRRL S-350]